MNNSNNDKPPMLRDRFAAAALTGWLSMCDQLPDSIKTHGDLHFNSIATICYRYADAMLRAREEASDE